MPRTYDVTMDPVTECHYVYLIPTDGTRLGGEFWRTAGASTTMVAVDTIAGTEVVRGIEVINPIEVRDEGALFPWSEFRMVEFIVGPTDEPVTTIVDGTRFDGSDVGEYPGLHVNYSPDGELVAIRIMKVRLPRPTGIRKLGIEIRRRVLHH